MRLDINVHSTLCNLLYVCVQAAKDARRWMGSRQFYDQMLVDACRHQQLKVTDEVDVTTMKEYMQVSISRVHGR